MFSAKDVKALRERTGAGMMDCKKALQETNGNMDDAITWLREKGISKAAKKAGGPEALVMTLIKFGRSQMIPKVIGTGIIGAGVGIGITKCVDCVRNYRKRLAKDAEIAKKELVEGINSYDAMHSEKEEE